MTVEQTYIEYLLLVNRNATNNNTNVDKPRFVLLYNDMKNKYVQWTLEKRNEDDIRYIQTLLVPELPLTVSTTTDLHIKYTLPTNYFDFANLHITAKKNCCDKVRMSAHEVKSEDVEELLNDVHNEPSLEFRETFYYIAGGKVCIFYKNFDLEKVRLTYYRYPNDIDIAGYINTLTGNPSVDIDPEFDDKVVRRILLAMAKMFSANNEDAQAYQIDGDRLFKVI